MLRHLRKEVHLPKPMVEQTQFTLPLGRVASNASGEGQSRPTHFVGARGRRPAARVPAADPPASGRVSKELRNIKTRTRCLYCLAL